VTRGRLPQRAGLPGLNGGGAAAAVPPFHWYSMQHIATEIPLSCNNNHPVSCDAGYSRHPDSSSRLRSEYYSLWQPAYDN